MDKSKNDKRKFLWTKALNWINEHVIDQRSKKQNPPSQKNCRFSVRIENKETLHLDFVDWSTLVNSLNMPTFRPVSECKRRSIFFKRRFSVLINNVNISEPTTPHTPKQSDNIAWIMQDATKNRISEEITEEEINTAKVKDQVPLSNLIEDVTDKTNHCQNENYMTFERLEHSKTENFGWFKKLGASVYKKNDSLNKSLDYQGNKEVGNETTEFYDANIIPNLNNLKKKLTIEEIIEHVKQTANKNSQIVLLPDDEFWAETANSECDIHRSNVFLSLLNIDQSAKIYENEFINKNHLNYTIKDQYNEKYILSILLGSNNNYEYRTIIRTSDKVLPGKMNMWQCDQPTSLQQIVRNTLPGITISDYKLLEGENVSTKILNYDKQTISSCFKFGVLYQKANQFSEEEMYENVNHSENMQTFLEFIAEPVSLENHQGFCGGLDTKYGLTGTTSYYTKFEGNEIMLHVSTLLPHCPNDKQQIERKRHIGNDIVTIIFQEPGACFCPSVISSQFLQAFICVQPVDENSYRIAVTAKCNISRFGPFIEGVGYYKKDNMFKKCLFSKLINAQIAACHSSGKIENMLRRRQRMLFEELYDDLYTSRVFSTSHSRIINHRSKSVELQSDNVDNTQKNESFIMRNRNSKFWSKKLSKLHSV